MGRKEDNIKKAQAIIHDKERIRNIGTAAHIDHGKCCAPDSRILFEGRWVAAKELFERFKESPLARRTREEEVRDVRSMNLKILTLDRQSRTFIEGELSFVWKLKATEALVRITAATGNSIATTPGHKYLVWRGNDFVEVPASMLTQGDRLAVRIPKRRGERARQFLATAPRISVTSRGSLAAMTEFLPTREQLSSAQVGQYEQISEDLWAIPVTAIRYEIEDEVYDFTVDPHHNFVAEGIVIHNTTLSDSLIAGAGMMSDELAGTQLFMDFDEQEQAR